MDQRSRDEDLTLNALKLDNQRLKRLYSKMGIKNAVPLPESTSLNSNLLSARIYEMLDQDLSIDEKILEIISETGNSLDISQIYVYYSPAEDNYKSSQWSYGEDFASFCEEDQKKDEICIELNNLLKQDNYLHCTNTEIEESSPISLIKKLILAKSVLGYSIVVSNKHQGFILFSEQSFNREWTSYETEMANTATNIIAGAIRNHQLKLSITSQSLKHQYIIRKILTAFYQHELPLENIIQNSLALVGEATHFDQLYIVLQNKNNNQIEYLWQKNSNHPPLVDKDQLTNLSFDNLDVKAPNILHINSFSILNLFPHNTKGKHKYATVALIDQLDQSQAWLIGESDRPDSIDDSPTNELLAIFALQIGGTLYKEAILKEEIDKQKKLLASSERDAENEIKHEEPVLKIVKDPPSFPNDFHWPNKLVLLVDENGSVHLQIRKYFDRTNLTLVSARTVTGATQLLKNRNDIDLVMMDLSFPDKDGSDLIKSIKNDHPHIPVISHTANSGNIDKNRLLMMGFDECLYKPTTKEQVLLILQEFLIEKERTKQALQIAE